MVAGSIARCHGRDSYMRIVMVGLAVALVAGCSVFGGDGKPGDRKSTRLNSSHER